MRFEFDLRFATLVELFDSCLFFSRFLLSLHVLLLVRFLPLFSLSLCQLRINFFADFAGLPGHKRDLARERLTFVLFPFLGLEHGLEGAFRAQTLEFVVLASLVSFLNLLFPLLVQSVRSLHLLVAHGLFGTLPGLGRCFLRLRGN